jgi:hypothetical protein
MDEESFSISYALHHNKQFLDEHGYYINKSLYVIRCFRFILKL